MSIKQNITSLQDLLERVNALPDAGGAELPELSNPATATEVFANKELIDADGNKIVGTFTIENELAAQDNLITQIQAAVDSLPEAGSGGGSIETVAGTISIDRYGALEGVYVGYTNQYQAFVEEVYYEDTVINVAKNSIVYIDEKCDVTGANYLGYIEAYSAYFYLAHSNFDASCD